MLTWSTKRPKKRRGARCYDRSLALSVSSESSAVKLEYGPTPIEPDLARKRRGRNPGGRRLAKHRASPVAQSAGLRNASTTGAATLHFGGFAGSALPGLWHDYLLELCDAWPVGERF